MLQWPKKLTKRLTKSVKPCLISSLVFAEIALGFPFSPVSQQPYDEVFDKQQQVRPHYREVVSILSHYSNWQVKRMQELSYKDFGADNQLFAIPRILTRSEFSFLQDGVTQRARALRAFLQDHYSGEKRYLRHKIIASATIRRILSRYHEENLDAWQDPNSIGFLYGPDIVRGPEGDFFVVEDNLGYLGGIGDLLIAKEILMKRLPELKQLDAGSDPLKFYQDIAASYRQRSVDGGKILALTYHPSLTEDSEEGRSEKIFSLLGIDSLRILDVEDRRMRHRAELLCLEQGVYYRAHPDAELEKVGLIFAGIEASDLAFEQQAYRGQRRASKVKALAQELRSQPLQALGFPGLYEAYLAGQVALVNGPGFDFLGDKEFYLSIETLIDFYLHERPLLRNIPSRSFATEGKASGVWCLDTQLLEAVFERGPEAKDHYVIKRVDGRGGDAVWVGAKISWEEFQATKPEIIAQPQNFIVQSYVPISQVDGKIVDLRLHADVSAESVIVAPIPWSRGVDASGNGKVNLSDKGGEFAVLIHRSRTQGADYEPATLGLSYLPEKDLGVENSGMLTRAKKRRGYNENDQEQGYVVKRSALNR